MRGRQGLGRGLKRGRGQGPGRAQGRGLNRGEGLNIRRRARDGSGRLSGVRQRAARTEVKKIALSSTGKEQSSEISEVFGRCSYFIYADISAGAVEGTEAKKNTLLAGKSGVGIAAAREIVENNADALITANIGPKALDVLTQFGIMVYKASGTVQEALKQFLAGTLEEFK